MAEATAALQFGDQKINNVDEVVRHRYDVAEHEAAPAAGRLKACLQLIGDLCRSASQRAVVAGGETQPMVQEFLASDLGIAAKPMREFTHEAHRRGIAGDDLGMERAQCETLRHCGKIV